MWEKKEYLRSLKRELIKRNHQDVEAVLDKYQSYFTLGAQAGMSEKDIVSRLPSPEEAAHLEDVVEPEIIVPEEVKIEGALQTFDEQIDSIDLKDPFKTDVEFVINNSITNPQIEFISGCPEHFNNHVEEGTLYICLAPFTAKTKNYFGFASASIRVHLPASELKSIKISSTTSEVRIPSLKAEELSVNTVSGTIKGGDIKVNNFRFALVSGNLEMESLRCHEAKINFVSGKGEIKYMEADEVKFNTVSGTLKIVDGHVESVKTSSVLGKLILSGKKYN